VNVTEAYSSAYADNDNDNYDTTTLHLSVNVINFIEAVNFS